MKPGSDIPDLKISAVLNPKEQFEIFLRQHFPDKAKNLMTQFELYLDILYALNQQVNLVSRRMPRDDYYLNHFLDSLLIIKCMEMKGSRALDFGSGGGLPGIPICLAYPSLQMTLLDSVGKKVNCLDQMITALDLKNCKAVWSRLEDFTRIAAATRYDYIFCRSVRLEPAFIRPLAGLLKPAGMAVFYKANNLEDVDFLPGRQICDVSLDGLGTRHIVTVKKTGFEEYLRQGKIG